MSTVAIVTEDGKVDTDALLAILLPVVAAGQAARQALVRKGVVDPVSDRDHAWRKMGELKSVKGKVVGVCDDRGSHPLSDADFWHRMFAPAVCTLLSLNGSRKAVADALIAGKKPTLKQLENFVVEAEAAFRMFAEERNNEENERRGIVPKVPGVKEEFDWNTVGLGQ